MNKWIARGWFSSPRRNTQRHVRQSLQVELLEDRITPATITVTGTGDTIATDGLATLREAITSINNQADVNADVTTNRVGGYASTPGGTPDVINFNIAGGGVHTITVTGVALPTIVMPLTIDGYSQPGASVNTLANADNAVLLIELNGTGAGAGADGLVLGAGSGGSTIKGLVVNRFAGDGIVVQSNGNMILGNFVGVDPTGTMRMPNGTFPSSGDGIRIENASNNQIGTTALADRNIASGNAIDGIHIVGTLTSPATGNFVQNNFVGVAADGVSSVGNRTEPAPAPGAAEGNNLFGIEVSGGNYNTIGGTTAGARNVVGFNGAGIEVDNGGQGNIIQGNYSGVGADGVTPVANLLHGIVLRSSNGFGAPLGPAQPNEPGVSFNLIGGTVAGAGNLVEFNGTGGIAIFGNPVSASGQPNIGNAIEGNSVFKNGRNFMVVSSAPLPLLGIDLTNGFLFPRDDGFTANDSKGHGAPNDPNNFQNFPVLRSATPNGANTDISGKLKAEANSTYRIEFFASDVDPLGLPAEGQQFLGFKNVTTDASGNATFFVSLAVSVTPGRIVTATATDSIGNTSEFSLGLTVPTPVPPNPNKFPIGLGSAAAGVAEVVDLAANGAVVASLSPIPGFTGEIRRATGDFNRDGVADVVWASGPFGTPRVRVLDGATGAVLTDFFAFNPAFQGGVQVATGDVNGDGVPDLIVGAGAGAGPHVEVIDGTKIAQIQANGQIANSALLGSFLAFAPQFSGGVTVAAGDINGDGRADVVVGAGAGAQPRVEVIDGTKLGQTQATGEIALGALLANFFAYDPAFAGGVFVAVGDFNGDGTLDVITGAGAAAPLVRVLDGKKLTQLQANGEISTSSSLADFIAYSGFTGGVRVDALDLDGDGKADIVTGAGPSGPPHVKVFHAMDLAVLDSFFAAPGIFIGGATV